MASSPSTPASGVSAGELAAIDTSARGPVLVFLVSAIAWLLIASALTLISSVQLHNPSFLADCAWFTYGRSSAAALNASVYGWGFNASFVLIFWLMARLSRAALRLPGVLVVSGVFWNLGVTVGLLGILGGHSTAVSWLEIPPYAAPLLFVAYALIGAWALVTFGNGRSEHIYASQWYLLAALFWFPWLYSVAQFMLFVDPVRGTAQTIVAAWYSHGVSSLWFTAVALAAIYYFLPKLTGKAIRHYELASLGFWTFLLFSSIAGVASLVGSPVPAWTQAAGVGASFFLLVPLLIIALNFIPSLGSAFKTPALRFIGVGTVAFLAGTAVWILTVIPSIGSKLQFTLFANAQTTVTLYGVFSMVAFGAVYFLAPRITQREWPSAALINAHFWASLVGLILCVVGLVYGGVTQASGLADPAKSFIEISQSLSSYLFAHSLGAFILAIGHLAFAVNVVRLILQIALDPSSNPVVLREAGQLEAAR